MKTRTVNVDGIPLHVAEAGEGPALLLVHGVSATHASWEHALRTLSARWRVIAPDLPGHGQSAKPDAPYTIDFYAGMMRSLGRELGLREAVIFGNSLGGQIAIEIGLSYPRWARALVLVAPAGSFGSAIKGLGQGLGWAVGSVAGPRVMRAALPLALERCFYDRRLPCLAERRRILAERLAHEDFPRFARAVTRSVVGSLAASRQPLQALTQPTLVVWGRDDRIVGVGASRRFVRDVPHARLTVLDRCGHLPMLERPNEFHRLVVDFLRSVEAAPLHRARRANGGS